MNKRFDKVLTVSVAAYNIEKYIREALDSFTGIKDENAVEVLIIDDGSTDNTASIAEDYCKRYPHVFRLIKKENGGWGSTVNTGIREAKGKYFRLLDGDDFFESDNIGEYISFLTITECDIVVSPVDTVNEDSKETGHFAYKSPLPGGSLKNTPDDWNLEVHSTAFRTDILKENDVFITENSFYTDMEYMAKAVSYCRNWAYFNKTVYKYRVSDHGQSMSGSGLIKHKDEHLNILRTLFDFYSSIDQDQNKALIGRSINIMIRSQYDIFWLLGTDRNGKELIRSFDNELHTKCRELYNSCASKKILLARFLRFHVFSVFSVIVKRKYGLNKGMARR